ncbi:FKBP-type peptidyl-prolyl cis-trans isomerase [Amycolatopsis pigmentata]|uniref:Peptidyl-prolyl cis-trans isomerase n=1 Tax=Amycolatopsis pigmentata TaxID=450801 RepID=A0ABW5FM79_9PSEU
MGNVGKIVIVVAAALSLAGCVNSQKASDYPPGDGPAYPAPNPVGASSSAAKPSTQARVCTADDIKVAGDPGAKPSITIPDTCTAPTTLLVKDLTPGTGPAAKAGSALTVNYDLVTWSDKVDQGAHPFSFTLGKGQAVPGWEQGLNGVKQGARRLIVVPPDLGYGPSGNQQVKPNETLVFVVDVTQVAG